MKISTTRDLLLYSLHFKGRKLQGVCNCELELVSLMIKTGRLRWFINFACEYNGDSVKWLMMMEIIGPVFFDKDLMQWYQEDMKSFGLLW